MKIYTLGSGHGDSTATRFNSSTAYETDDGILYLVDAGAPVEALLRRKGLLIHNVRAAFITHMHDDHAGGLSGLIKQVVKYPKDRLFPFSLYLPEDTAITPLKNWVLALHEDANDKNVQYFAVEKGPLYEDEHLAVSAIGTAHLRTKGRFEGDPCSFAYLLHFKKENCTILHTGDLWHDFSDFPRIAALQHFDACVCEATHYHPESALPALQKAQFDRLIFSHIGDRWHTHVGGGWELDNGEKRLYNCFKHLPYPVMIAHDGDEFVL